MKRNAIVLIAGLVSCAGGPALAGSWVAYENARFGTIADVPASGFTLQPAPTNGDGRTWISDDGRGQIRVYGAFIVTAEDLAGYRREILGYARDDGVDITYSAAKTNWFVFSGFLGNDIVYKKVVVSCDATIGNHIYLRYPASQKKKYNQLVRHIAKSLASNDAADSCN